MRRLVGFALLALSLNAGLAWGQGYNHGGYSGGTGGGGTVTGGTGCNTVGTSMLKGSGTAGGCANAVAGTDYQLPTSGSGMLKANGAGGTTPAVAGTDYQAPIPGNSVPLHYFATTISQSGMINGAQPAAGDITGLAASATTDATNATNIVSGTLAAARLPFTLPLSVANGGSGTATPSLVGGTNVTINGSWPNQTISAASGTPGAPLTNPAGGQNNYAPLDSPVFTTALTLPSAPSCTGGQVLSGISTTLAPTCVTPSAAPSALHAPSWMYYLCDGSEADPNLSSGTTNVQGVHCYSSFTLTSPAIMSVQTTASAPGAPTDKPNGAFIVLSTGACNVSGAINAAAIITSTNSLGGSAGGGGGYGSVTGTPGTGTNIPAGNTAVPLASGGAGGTSGVAGGVGSTPTASGTRAFLDFPMTWGVCGSAPGGTGGSSGGTGGLGGGCVALICNSLNFTGAINVNGGNGGAGGASTGGGGGGGGGIVILAGRTIVANTGTVNTAGGNGGVIGTGTSTAGGAGGAGISRVFTLN